MVQLKTTILHPKYLSELWGTPYLVASVRIFVRLKLGSIFESQLDFGNRTGNKSETECPRTRGNSVDVSALQIIEREGRAFLRP
jgi:hypothetical protein